MESVGYIYTLRNETCGLHNARKLGKYENIPNINSGYFDLVIQVDIIILEKLEKDLIKHFKEYHIKLYKGMEYFKMEIKDLIIPYLKSNNISYGVLYNEEISNLTQKNIL